MNCKTTILAIALAATIISGHHGFAQNYGGPGQTPPFYPGAEMYGGAPAGFYAGPPAGNFAPQPGGYPAVQPVGYPTAPAGVYPAMPNAFAPGPAGVYALPPAMPFTAQPAAYYGQPADAGMSPQPIFADGYGAYEDYGQYMDPAMGAPCVDDYCSVYYPWKFWGSIDALYWTRQGRSLPALVTTSPAGTPRNAGPTNPIAGSLGQPTTTTLFGGNRVNDQWQVGAQAEMGMWFDDHREVGLGVRGFALAEDEVTFNAASSGTTILGRPFFNTVIGKEDALLVAYTNADPAQGPFTAGSISARTVNQLYGADGFLRVNWGRGCGYSVDLIGGYQFTRINDSLVVQHQFRDLSTNDMFFGLDSFRTRNEFHGGEFGINAEFQQGPWTLTTLGKVGLGNTRQTVLINGTNTQTFAGIGSFVSNGALLTQNSNTGTYKQDQFTFVPNVAVDLGFQVNDYINVSLGYSFMYWSSVVLAGDQIDRNIDPRQFGGATVPGAGGPFFKFNDTDFWAQGINVSVNGRY